MHKTSSVEIRLTPANILRMLCIVSGLLICLSLISAFFRLYLKTNLRGTVWFFEVSGDSNIPTWYASITLLFCAILLAIIGRVRWQEKDKYAKHWCILSGIFCILSIDEVAMLHEWTANLVSVPTAGGFLYYRWVVFGLAAVVLLGLYYWRFLISLPPKIRKLFLLAAFVFIGGALGIEIINSKLDYVFGYESLAYTLTTAFEELCEMLGVAIFVYALLLYLERWVSCNSFKVYFSKKYLL